MGRRGGGGGRIPTAYAIYSELCRAGLGWLREGGRREGGRCWGRELLGLEGRRRQAILAMWIGREGGAAGHSDADLWGC
eukprot:COSAG02_NODE_1814_length_10782_cov_383.824862_2_plen_79_part_00